MPTGKLPGVLVVHYNRGPFGANEPSERGRLKGAWREVRLTDGTIIKQALIDCAPK